MDKKKPQTDSNKTKSDLTRVEDLSEFLHSHDPEVEELFRKVHQLPDLPEDQSSFSLDQGEEQAQENLSGHIDHDQMLTSILLEPEETYNEEIYNEESFNEESYNEGTYNETPHDGPITEPLVYNTTLSAETLIS